jgi:hypothetical protein
VKGDVYQRPLDGQSIATARRLHRPFIGGYRPLIGIDCTTMARTLPRTGGTVPRAKRTARADARRRYRASQSVPEDVDELEAVDDEGGQTSATAAKPPPPRRAAAATSPAATPPRPSIATAFRQAFRPIDLRGDLMALPSLLINKAFWIPAGGIVAIAGVVLFTGGKELVSQVLAPYFLYPPPIAPVFLAGFLAPRGSWLLGGIIGVVQSIVTLVLVLASPTLNAATGAADPGVLAYSLFVSVGFGAFYAAAAAWYKRFLQGANPPRRAATSSKSGSQKRGGGSNSRPLLARKR